MKHSTVFPPAGMNRQHGLGAMLALAILGAVSASTGAAEAYFARPVHIVVPVSAGGSTDKIARLIAQRLGEHWSQPVVVENVRGAGGNIGAARVAPRWPA